MIARCCTNQKCKTISTYVKCPVCDSEAQPLPSIQLGMIGLDARASLHRTEERGYYIQVDKPSGRDFLDVKVLDIKHIAQPGLPYCEPVTGLMIMDSLYDASALIASKSPSTWHGWILYLIEALQARTDKEHYQALLQALIEELRAKRLHE